MIYELHVGTFTPEGTLDAATERLGHLVDLGVDVVELLPLAPFPGARNWGYDGVAPYAVHEAYGGPAALQRFVDAAHAAGLGVCLDLVYNHLGPDGNHLAEFGPYLTDRHTTPWGLALNLDAADSDPVRHWVLDNVAQWFVDFHADGLRLDAVHELHDHRATHVLEEMARLVDDLAEQHGRAMWLVAESDRNDPGTVTPRGTGAAVGGQGLHGQWADDVHHALHVALTGETQGYYADFAEPEALAKVMRTPFFHDGTHSSFRGRGHGRPVDPTSVPGWRFVASLQTHDQVGNRAIGDRLSALVEPGLLACGAAILLTSPWTPMLFMGEEWGASTPWQYFTDHTDRALGEAVAQRPARRVRRPRVVRDGRARPAGPGDVRAVEARLGRAREGAARPAAAVVPAAARAAPRASGPARPAPRRGGGPLRRTGPAPSRCDAATTRCWSTSARTPGPSTRSAASCRAGSRVSKWSTVGSRCRPVPWSWSVPERAPRRLAA